MTEINRALADLALIRNQIAGARLFRGFGPTVVAGTGVLALIAAMWQNQQGVQAAAEYFTLWLGVAVLSLALIGTEMWALSKRHHGGLAGPFVWGMAEAFLPAGLAGASIAAVLYRFVPEAMGLLPGLWQILIALGLFSAGARLPASLRIAGAWYFLAGLASLILASTGGLSPWLMGLPFGLGQLLVALCLYLAGRNHG
ncbi:hypothetical protein [Cypionkella psychrotolerans]|uniref:hypothetical protein n=1 Tax=Cypionkella psychrotolerans TaxID=1678131 RepID=UPI0006B56752|nr:hypothetical protein [Cypionkella psychrotolerans]